MRQKNDNLSFIADTIGLLKSFSHPIRIEEVYSEEELIALKALLQPLNLMNKTTKILLEGGAIKKIKKFCDYFDYCVGSEIELLRKAMKKIKKSGIVSLSKTELLEFHKAETKLKNFVLPSQIEKYDYQFSKLMQKDKLYEVKKLLIVNDDSINTETLDYDEQPDEETVEEEGGVQVLAEVECADYDEDDDDDVIYVTQKLPKKIKKHIFTENKGT